MRTIIAQLDRMRRTGRVMLITQRTAVLATWILGGALALVAFDYVLRLPSLFRATLLVGALATFAWACTRYLLPAMRFNPTITQLALRIERLMPALGQRLASSVEFASSGVDQANPLAARSVREVEGRVGTATTRSFAGVIRSGPTWRDLGIFIAMTACVWLLAWQYPASAQVGLQRLLLPFGDAAWPARTGVASAMHDVLGPKPVHPRGQALTLRAQVTRGADDQSVHAQYRLFNDGAYGQWRNVVLTHQGDGRHERLIDTNAERVELYFTTDDAGTQPEIVTLVPPPMVTRATLNVTPPDYARDRVASYEAELGTGMDDRSIAPSPGLVGSHVTLDIQFNKALPVGDDDDDAWLTLTLGWSGESLPEFTALQRETPDADNVGQDASDAAHSPHWRLTWRLDETTSLDLSLVDQYGLVNLDPITFRIDAVEDRRPSVTIIEPASDEAVLATAVVSLAAEGRDDVALSRVSLEARVLKRGEDAVADEAVWSADEAVDAPTVELQRDLDLASLAVNEGDIVIVTAQTEDDYALDGDTHPPTVSSPRRLRIISDIDLATQLRRDLSAVRQNAIRVERQQGELQDDLIDDSVQPGMSRAQAQVSERVAEQREALEQIAQRMQNNRLDDAQLDELIAQSGDLLDFAGRAANRAVEQMQAREAEGAPTSPRGEPGDAAADAQSGDDAPDATAPPEGGEPSDDPDPSDESDRPDDPGEPADPDQPGDADADHVDPDDDLDEIIRRQPDAADREIFDAQQEVREELADLIELLDRDEDTWLITRQLQELIESQRDLQADAADIAEQTLGRNRDELTPVELNELDRIAQRQRDLADQAREAIEEMRQRAEALEDVDPQAAEALEASATRGEQQELDRNMEQAAQRAEQNQMRQARQSQQAARQTLEEMLEAAQNIRRAQTEELQRRLASLIESIRRLIVIQENELVALAQARQDADGAGDFTGRDRAMIRLNQNTTAVAAEARSASSGGQETRRIARALDRAADAQGEAIASLRATPIDADRAEEAESRSLELLKEAEELTEALEEDLAEQQMREQREELLDRYRELLERQVMLRRDTLELAERAPLDRRGIVDARRLGSRQDELRNGMDEVHASVDELRDSSMFTHAHEQLDAWSRTVAEQLQDANVSVTVTNRQDRIAQLLARIITALEDAFAPPEQFDDGNGQQEGQQGGQGAQGQQQVIPDIAELRLMRMIQEQLLEQTRTLDERGDLDAAARQREARELGEEQHALMELGQTLLDQLAPPRDASDGAPERPDQSDEAGESGPAGEGEQ